MLSYHTLGSGPRLAFVHGFTQTRQTWDDTLTAFSTSYTTVAIDAPDHGASNNVSLDLESGGKAIIEVGQTATYVGYSLGGRLSLTAALQFPQFVQRLILISSTAGIDSDAERKARVISDEALATKIELIGVEKFVDEWLDLPMFSGLNIQNNQRTLRLTNSARGLASSLRLCGAGKQRPSWSILHKLSMPVLVIAGQHDHKFAQIAHRLADSIGSNAELQIISNSGHTPHLEQPQAFINTVNGFLDQTQEK